MAHKTARAHNSTAAHKAVEAQRAAVAHTTADVRKAAEAANAYSSEVSGLFGQAVRALGDSLKVAMKAQEDTVRFWGQAAGSVNPVQAIAGDLIPTAEKSADEIIRLMESSYRRNADLLKKVIHSPSNGNGDGLEKRTREWWEASLEAARDNVQDMASTNMRIVQSWTEVFKNGAQIRAAAGR